MAEEDFQAQSCPLPSTLGTAGCSAGLLCPTSRGPAPVARQLARSGLLGPLGHCRAQPFSPAFSQPQRHKDNLSQSTVPVSEVPSPAKVPSQPPSLLDELCPSLCARSWFCLQLGRWQCGPSGTARCDARVLWPALGQGQGHGCVCHHLSAPTC